MKKKMKGIRVDVAVHTWLFNHRTASEKTCNDVIRELIALKDKEAITKQKKGK